MKIIAILVSILSVISVFSGISYEVEPHSWVPSTSLYTNYNVTSKYFKNVTATPNPEFLTTYNLTGSGGKFTVALGGCDYGPASGVHPPSCSPIDLCVFGFWVSIISENLSFPYNAMSLEIGNDSLSSSGPILMNVSAYNDSNIFTAFPYSQYMGGYFGTNPNGTVHINPNKVSSPITSYQMSYRILTGYNYTTEHLHYLRMGNYTLNFTLHFTPVFEIGPYFEVGKPLSISLKWKWTILSYQTGYPIP